LVFCNFHPRPGLAEFNIELKFNFMKITYYGHSCFSVFAGGKHLLFDPFISGNDLAKNVDIEAIPADYIFVSHGHFDHMLDVVPIAKRTGALVLGVWELYDYFSKQGLENVRPINPGGQVKLDFGTVKSVPALHSSSFSNGSYAGVAAGFVFKTADGNFYYSGDTALSVEMSLIPEWADLDFAVLPIGDALTLGVEDAIEAAKYVHVNKVFGVHYDTFGFIMIDHHEAQLAFRHAELELYLAKAGEDFEI
jgi:L-ascorbate metabolism protein UlaG (beta-lactamase superfamily)